MWYLDPYFREKILNGLLDGFVKQEKRRSRPSNVNQPSRLTEQHFIAQYDATKYKRDCVTCLRPSEGFDIKGRCGKGNSLISNANSVIWPCVPHPVMNYFIHRRTFAVQQHLLYINYNYLPLHFIIWKVTYYSLHVNHV